MSAIFQAVELNMENEELRKVVRKQDRMLARLVALVDIVLEGGSVAKADLAKEVVKYRRWKRQQEMSKKEAVEPEPHEDRSMTILAFPPRKEQT